MTSKLSTSGLTRSSTYVTAVGYGAREGTPERDRFDSHVAY